MSTSMQDCLNRDIALMIDVAFIDTPKDSILVIVGKETPMFAANSA
jgi:hypothetical protein